MFERFTDRARRIVVLAQEEAKVLMHSYIGTEHLLLGMMRESGGVAYKALDALGLSIERVRSGVIDSVGMGSTIPTGHIPFTPRAKNALEISLREALELNHNYIGTEHILLGVMNEEQGMACQVLSEFGLTIETIRREILRVLAEEPEDEEQEDEAKEEAKEGEPKKDNNSPPKSNKKQDQFPTVLEKFGYNLTQSAKDGEIDPVIGREKETERLIQILCRRTKNNPVLIGDAGVGKTAIVEGLALAIANDLVPDKLAKKIVYTLDLNLLVAGSRYRGDFEERLKKIVKEIKNRGDIIVFIDEIHTLIGTGSAEGSLDAANILKPLLARGQIRTIGATTINEYRRSFERDGALERRFQKILVEEPSIDQALYILKGIRKRYEAYHKVSITDAALKAAVTLSDRYIHDRKLPDKAIDLLDEAASRVRLSADTDFPQMRDVVNRLIDIRARKKLAIEEERFEDANTIRVEEKAALKERIALKKQLESEDTPKPVVDEKIIAELISTATKIPVDTMSIEETARLREMEQHLQKRVIGQKEAIRALCSSIRRTRAGLKNPDRPAGSFIFAGPTGVGKTELARALADFLFADEESLITLDMSEYSEKHTVSRLFGPPPGYVGYEDGGQLTERIRRRPFSVILFDEIEKAHPDIFNSLLQILENGRLTDSRGKVVDFKNTIIIMTTNSGARDITASQPGFRAGPLKQQQFELMQGKITKELKKDFRPEFLNRVDEIIIFPHLDTEELRQISKIFAQEIIDRMEEKDITLSISDSAIDFLIERGKDLSMGARPMRRAFVTYVEDKIANEILDGNLKAGGKIVIDAGEEDTFATIESLQSSTKNQEGHAKEKESENPS